MRTNLLQYYLLVCPGGFSAQASARLSLKPIIPYAPATLDLYTVLMDPVYLLEKHIEFQKECVLFEIKPNTNSDERWIYILLIGDILHHFQLQLHRQYLHISHLHRYRLSHQIFIGPLCKTY